MLKMSTKLNPSFVLCSISGQNDVRGVTSHPESMCVIGTINRNMVSNFKVTEQRPIGSWTSREGYYGAAVYDTESKQYAALLDTRELKLWKESDNKIAKLKKYVFHSSIWSLVTGVNNEAYVVYKNGYVKTLSSAVETRKDPVEFIIPDEYSILDCRVVQVKDKVYTVLVTTYESEEYFIYLHELNNGEMEYEGKFELKPIPKSHLSGLTIQAFDNTLSLLTLWSNESLYSLPLLNWQASNWGNELGKVEGICTSECVALAALSVKHVAIYGADPSKEGAMLLIYNSQFQVVQARQKLKLYNSPPLLWGPFDNLLVIAASNHLLVVKFKLGYETIASMMGSACNTRTVESGTQLKKVAWTKGKKVKSIGISLYLTAPESISKIINGFSQQGFSEAEIVSQLAGDLIEKRDVTAITWCLQNLKEIPESVLAKFTSFCLKEPDSVFNDDVSDQTSQSVSAEESALQSTFTGGRKKLLDLIIKVPFNIPRLLPELKRYLAPKDAMLLLQYLCAKMWHGEEPTQTSEDQLGQLLTWCCAILDSNYQHCLLSMDSQVLKTLTALSDAVDTQIAQVEELKALEPLLLQMKQGRRLPEHKEEDRIYTIETLHLL